MSLRNGHGRILLVVFSLSFLIFSLPASTDVLSIDSGSRVNTVTPSDGQGVIVIDYSHGQESTSSDVIVNDALLVTELEAMGYIIVKAYGGLNSSILSSADGLLISPIFGEGSDFLTSEITAISEWFNSNSKFLWIGCESDFTSLPNEGQFINDNMALVLEAVSSHVYPEPTQVQDPVSYAGAAYRPIANQTSTDPLISEIVKDVEAILMHSPTLLYGSDNDANPGVGIDSVALEGITINEVYPLLYYSDFATIVDFDLTAPIAHDENDVGAFVATTIELNAGEIETGVITVSGGSPYGRYRSMHINDYYGHSLNGSIFVPQVIDFGMNFLDILVDDVADLTYEEGQEIWLPFNFVTWHPSCASPKFYNITLDDVLIKNGLWNSSSEEISINFEGHTPGVYNYTLTVVNSLNQTASDSVLVTVEAPALPVVNHPANITYVLGETSHVIEWEFSDCSLKNYSVYRNGVFVLGTANNLLLGPTTWSALRSVDGLSVGLYNYTIVVTDWLNQYSTDTVWVEVLEATSTTTTTTTTATATDTGDGDLSSAMILIISIGSVVIIVIVLVLVKRKT